MSRSYMVKSWGDRYVLVEGIKRNGKWTWRVPTDSRLVKAWRAIAGYCDWKLVGLLTGLGIIAETILFAILAALTGRLW
jgi:hypothetical protein